MVPLAPQVEDTVMGEDKNQNKDAGQYDKTQQSDQGGKPAFSQIGEKDQQSELGQEKQEQFDEVEGRDFEKGEIQGNDMGKPEADDGSQPQKGQEEFAGSDKSDRQDDPGSKG